MSKGNVDIRNIPVKSRKITDTYNSQISRNYWVLIRKPKIVRPSHNVHVCHDLLHHNWTCRWVFVCGRI